MSDSKVGKDNIIGTRSWSSQQRTTQGDSAPVLTPLNFDAAMVVVIYRYRRHLETRGVLQPLQ